MRWADRGADAQAFPLQLRGRATQRIPQAHLATQLLGPGWSPGHGSVPRPLGQGSEAWGAPSGLSLPAWPSAPSSSYSSAFSEERGALFLSDTQEGEGIPGSAPADTQLGILIGRRKTETDPLRDNPLVSGFWGPWGISS